MPTREWRFCPISDHFEKNSCKGQKNFLNDGDLKPIPVACGKFYSFDFACCCGITLIDD
jgi:hypothetical protein